MKSPHLYSVGIDDVVLRLCVGFLILCGLNKFVDIVDCNAVDDVERNRFGRKSGHSLVFGIFCADLDDDLSFAKTFHGVCKHHFVSYNRVKRSKFFALNDFKDVSGIKRGKLSSGCALGLTLNGDKSAVCNLVVVDADVDVFLACKHGFARDTYCKRRV